MLKLLQKKKQNKACIDKKFSSLVNNVNKTKFSFIIISILTIKINKLFKHII